MAGPASTLTNEQLAEMIALIKGADSVELKLTIPDSAHRSALRALDVDPLEAQIRQVVFFDTPNLDLDESGIVVRARRSQGADDDTVVKLRPVVPSELPDELRMSPSFNVEVDAMPGGYVCSGSMKGKIRAGEVREPAPRREGAPQDPHEGPAGALRAARARGTSSSRISRSSDRSSSSS